MRPFPLLFAVLLSLVPACSAPADAQANARAAINEAYVGLNTAVAEKDVNKALAFLTDDWHGVNADGRVFTKRPLGPALRRALTGVSGMTTRTTIESLSLRGKMANVRTRTVAVLLRQVPTAARPGGRTQSTEGTAEWVKTGAGWKMRRVRGPSFLLAIRAMPPSATRRTTPRRVVLKPRRAVTPPTAKPAPQPASARRRTRRFPRRYVPVFPVAPRETTPPSGPPPGGFSPPTSTR